MVKKKKSGFPSNSRSISESIFSFIRAEKSVLLASLSGVFFFCLMLYATVALSASLQKKQQVIVEKEQVVKEITFWEGVTQERPDYRDGYFMLAVLQYRIGKADAAAENVAKALKIDPNFEEGRKFEKMLK